MAHAQHVIVIHVSCIQLVKSAIRRTRDIRDKQAEWFINISFSVLIMYIFFFLSVISNTQITGL